MIYELPNVAKVHQIPRDCEGAVLRLGIRVEMVDEEYLEIIYLLCGIPGLTGRVVYFGGNEYHSVVDVKIDQHCRLFPDYISTTTSNLWKIIPDQQDEEEQQAVNR